MFQRLSGANETLREQVETLSERLEEATQEMEESTNKLTEAKVPLSFLHGCRLSCGDWSGAPEHGRKDDRGPRARK